MFSLLLYLTSLQLAYSQHSNQNDTVIYESDNITHLLKSLQWLFFWLWVKVKIILMVCKTYIIWPPLPLWFYFLFYPLSFRSSLTNVFAIHPAHKAYLFLEDFAHVFVSQIIRQLTPSLLSALCWIFKLSERLSLITIVKITATTPPAFPTSFLW